MIGKRGQFYLIAAIIIVMVIYSLSTRVNIFIEQPRFTDFDKLAENYINEVTKIVNHGLYNKIVDIPASLIAPFTNDFIRYARTRDKDIGLVYVYGDNSRTIIENHLNNQIIIYNSSDPGLSGQLFSSNSESINQISLRIGEDEFSHDVPVRLSSFSSSYFSASANPVDSLKIDVGGVPFFFSAGSGNILFDVIIKTVDESSRTINQKICRYDSSLGGWQAC